MALLRQYLQQLRVRQGDSNLSFFEDSAQIRRRETFAVVATLPAACPVAALTDDAECAAHCSSTKYTTAVIRRELRFAADEENVPRIEELFTQTVSLIGL